MRNKSSEFHELRRSPLSILSKGFISSDSIDKDSALHDSKETVKTGRLLRTGSVTQRVPLYSRWRIGIGCRLERFQNLN